MSRLLSVLTAVIVLTCVSTYAIAHMNAPVPIETEASKEELFRFVECHPELLDKAELKIYRNEIYTVMRLEGPEICEAGECPTMVYKPNDKNNRCGLNIYAGNKISFPDALGPVHGRNNIMIYLNGDKHTLGINVLFDPPILDTISETGPHK
jgi:hypothetical protein